MQLINVPSVIFDWALAVGFAVVMLNLVAVVLRNTIDVLFSRRK